MFGEAAEALLRMSGQSGNVPGAIMAEDVPAALAALQAALKLESSSAADDSGIDKDADQGDHDDDHANKVALGTRAVPLIELLEAAIKSNGNVQWDH